MSDKNRKALLAARTFFIRLSDSCQPDLFTWVFSSTDNRSFNYNSRYLFEYVLEHCPQVTALYVMNDPELRGRLAVKYGENHFIHTDTAEGIRQALGAGVWFTSAGLPVYGTGLAKNRMIINLWHGIPLKKIALADPHLGALSRLYFKKVFSENYTFITTPSSRLIPVMAKSFAVPEEKVKVWGQPRTDCLLPHSQFSGGREEEIGFLSDHPGYRHLIVYAPTFREEEPTRWFPFEDFDRERLEAFLKMSDSILVLRPHLREEAAIREYCSQRVCLAGSRELEDITHLLRYTDLLITDYSSVYLDYLMLDRPMVFLPYDRKRYRALRGMNFDYDEVTPGPKPGSFEAFLAAIEAGLDGKDDYGDARRHVRELFYDDISQGSCERICNEILGIFEGT